MAVVKSLLSDIAIPDICLQKAIFTKCKEYGEAIALVDGITGDQYTFNDVIDISKRIASGLVKLGFQKGDIISLYSYNTAEWVFMFLGALCAGGTITTVNPAYTKYELNSHLRSCGAKYLYTVRDMLNVVHTATENTSIKKIICLNSDDASCIPYSHLASDDASMWSIIEEIQVNPKEDLVCILYSSGTTGLPKGVMLTHYNILATMCQYGHPGRKEEVTEVDVNLLVLPLFHIFGLIAVLILGFTEGNKSIMLRHFEPKSFLGAIEKYKVTNLALVPPLLVFLVKSPLVNAYDLSSVKWVSCGAAPLSKETEEEAKERLNIQQIAQGYGLTETSAVCLPFENKPGRPGSCGYLVSNVEAKVIDVEKGNMLGPNEKGELCFKGPNIMKGYFNNHKATMETIDSDGFLHTGDVGYYDEEGNFYVIDRIKELIKVKGFQVAPAELEALLLSHPKVGDVGVTGVADERGGEVPKAFIVKKTGVQLSAQELNHYVAERTAAYKHLKGGVDFVSEIPKLPSGKIIRRKLKELSTKSKL